MVENIQRDKILGLYLCWPNMWKALHHHKRDDIINTTTQRPMHHDHWIWIQWLMLDVDSNHRSSELDFPLHDFACWGIVFVNIYTFAHIVTSTSATTTSISPYITLWPSTRYITIWRYCWHTKVMTTWSSAAFFTTCAWWRWRWRSRSRSRWWWWWWVFFWLWFFLRRRLDLNALDSSTSFAVYFFLDLFRTATHHSDCHRVCLLVICLVLDFYCSLINIINPQNLVTSFAFALNSFVGVAT